MAYGMSNILVYGSIFNRPRKAKNPKNGKEHFVPVRYYVRFKPGKALIGKITEYNLMQNPQE
jgi:hypothetical protein